MFKTNPNYKFNLKKKKSYKLTVKISLVTYAVQQFVPYSRGRHFKGAINKCLFQTSVQRSRRLNGINSSTTIPSRALAARIAADIEFRAVFKADFWTGTTAIETIFQEAGLCFSVIIVTVSDLHTNLDSIQSYRHCKSPK